MRRRRADADTLIEADRAAMYGLLVPLVMVLFGAGLAAAATAMAVRGDALAVSGLLLLAGMFFVVAMGSLLWALHISARLDWVMWRRLEYDARIAGGS